MKQLAQVRRDHTPRRFNREALELTLEFALHGGGKASDWARASAYRKHGAPEHHEHLD